MKKFLLGTVADGNGGTAGCRRSCPHPYTGAAAARGGGARLERLYRRQRWLGFERKCWDFTTPGGAFIAAEGCHDATGGVAGGQIGYRWQSSSWVFGVEAQGDWADLKGSNVSPLTAFRIQSRINAFGLFTGQVGYAVNNVLGYVKGGAAVTNDKFDIFTSAVGVPPNTLVANTGDQTRWGGVVGVGLEYGFAPNWSAAIEYDYLSAGQGHQVRDRRPAVPPGVLFSNDRIRQNVEPSPSASTHRWRPVVARY